MSFDIEKVNNLLQQDGFTNKLKRDLSNEGIVKTFGDVGVSITTEDAQDFKKRAMQYYNKYSKEHNGPVEELSDNQLNVSGGKISVEKGVHDVFKGAGTVIRSTAKGVGTVMGSTARGVGTVVGGVAKGVADAAVGTGKGVGRSIWGIVQIPGSLAIDIGKGIYDGIRDGITGRKN